MEKRDKKFLHCPPHEGIGREEAADVRKPGFILRASVLCVTSRPVFPNVTRCFQEEIIHFRKHYSKKTTKEANCLRVNGIYVLDDY